MKKIISTVVAAMIMTSLSAQNGGQSPENAALKIEYVSMVSPNIAIVKVTNKQLCNSDIMVFCQSRIRTKNVQAQSSDTFYIQIGALCKVFAQPTVWCGGMNYGTVELNVCVAMPVTLEYLNVIQSGPGEIEVEFKIAEATGTQDHFNVQVSTDGINFKTVKVLLPSQARANQIYNAKIKL